MSPRSFQRALHAYDTTYRRVLFAVLRERAERLLSDPSLSVAEVATRVGFTDPANFSRAFRHWAGTTPGDFRHAMTPGDPGRSIDEEGFR